MKDDLTIAAAQQVVDTWIRGTGKGYFSILTNLGILTEEVGEVARILVRSHGEQSFKESDKGRDLADELADVVWVTLCLANQTGINLEAAFRRNLEKKNLRDAGR